MSTTRLCHYCTNKKPATHVVHDRRGCLKVCEAHAAWRKTTSGLVGHEEGCPGKAGIWKHVTVIHEPS